MSIPNGSCEGLLRSLLFLLVLSPAAKATGSGSDSELVLRNIEEGIGQIVNHSPMLRLDLWCVTGTLQALRRHGKKG
jgi:hypothetical protein